MEPLIAALGGVLLSVLRMQVGWPGILSDPAFFWGGTGAAALLAFLAGRLVLPRLPLMLFSRVGTLVVLALQAAVLSLTALPVVDDPSHGAAFAVGLVPNGSCYLALGLGSHGSTGKPRGITFLDWLAPRLYLMPQLFVLLAGGVLTGMAAVLWRVSVYGEILPTVCSASLLLLSGVVVILLPYLVRFLFPARRMVGPLADRLDLLARRAGVGLRGMLIWETRTRRVSTACVTGFFSWNRYVFFTDCLLDTLEADEVEAVFAHELSHLRCRHLPLLLALCLGGVALCLGCAQLFLAGAAAVVREALLLLWLGAFILVPFARISRIFELEADLASLQFGADPGALTRALKKLRALSGKAHKRHGWRHFSIPYRLKAIESWMNSESYRRHFRRVKRAAVATVFAVFLVGGFSFFASGAYKLDVVSAEGRLGPEGGSALPEIRRGEARAQGVHDEAVDRRRMEPR